MGSFVLFERLFAAEILVAAFELAREKHSRDILGRLKL
jgi:hypothetical protein